MESQKYEVLGIHTSDSGEQVARVRMFVNGVAVDEDMPYPNAISSDEQLEANTLKRIAEYEKGVKAQDSKLTVGDGDQIVNKEYTATERGYDV